MMPEENVNGAGAGAGQGAAGQGSGQQGGAGAGEGAGAGTGSGQQAGEGAGQQGAFAIPEAYKDRGWAQKVKSLDDVFKQIDTLDALKGKKMVVPDFEKGTPEEIEGFLKLLRPKDKSEYAFPEGSAKEITEKIADIFYQNGIPKAFGNKIISAYAELEKGVIAQRFSKDGMETILKTSFGDDYQKAAGETANLLAKNLSEDDRKLLEKIPNEHLGLIYRLTNNLIKAYGIKEGVAGEAGAGKGTQGNVEEVRKSLRKQIADLDKRPHTSEEKQKLLDKLSATYKQ